MQRTTRKCTLNTHTSRDRLNRFANSELRPQVFERAQAAGLTNAYDYYAVFEAYLDVFVRKGDAEHVRKNFANGAPPARVHTCVCLFVCVRPCMGMRVFELVCACMCVAVVHPSPLHASQQTPTLTLSLPTFSGGLL